MYIYAHKYIYKHVLLVITSTSWFIIFSVITKQLVLLSSLSGCGYTIYVLYIHMYIRFHFSYFTYIFHSNVHICMYVYIRIKSQISYIISTLSPHCHFSGIICHFTHSHLPVTATKTVNC